MRIRKENLPEKCEICHKSDCFDPIKNICNRCVGLNIEILERETRNNKKTVNHRVFITTSIFNKIQMMYLFISFIPFVDLLITLGADDGYGFFISLSILSFLLGLVILIFSLLRKENIFVILAATFFVSLSPIYLLLPVGIISVDEIFLHIIRLSKFKITY